MVVIFLKVLIISLFLCTLLPIKGGQMQKEIKFATSFKEQLTPRSLIIGTIGSVIVTCASLFVALKASSLPFPIMFVALLSMFVLKALGRTNINEINVTHTAMSAGSMVAGGVAFTIPAIYMLFPNEQIRFTSLLIIIISGTLLGLIFTSLMRKQFIEKAELPYAMGHAAAETLIAGDEGGKKAHVLFASFGFAALFTILRDWFLKIPALIWFKNMMSFGSLGGIWLSPMLISVGYLVGPIFIGVWFLGALIGDVGIVILCQKFSFFDATTASNIKSALGLGLMVGTGVGIFLKNIFPNIKSMFSSMTFSASKKEQSESIIPLRWAPIAMVVLAFLFVLILDIPIFASVVTILGVWLVTAMSCQTVGMSAINPMEVFGIVVLLIARLVSPSTTEVAAIFIAAIVATACGLVGDVMNDFKAGHILKTDPKAQWTAELLGGLVGAVVSAIVVLAIVTAYGTGAFGNPELFPAAQASAVAAMAGGIENMPVFFTGLVLAALLYILGFYPVMTLGLGVYLPFYLSFTAFIGAMLRLLLDKIQPAFGKSGKGTVIAAGLLGGEAVIGVVIAIVLALQFVFL